MPIKKAEATWKGNLKEGLGTVKLGSGMFEGMYSFASRFEDDQNTNPEELIGAAHAGCYSMAFSNELSKAGYTVNSMHTTADVNLEMTDDGPAITSISLNATGDVDGVDNETFQKIAEAAKVGCPVSKALASTKINLKATLS